MGQSHLARVVHHRYFDLQYKEFAPRTIWNLSNAFTSPFKELVPISQFKATAKLASSLRLQPEVRNDCVVNDADLMRRYPVSMKLNNSRIKPE